MDAECLAAVRSKQTATSWFRRGLALSSMAAMWGQTAPRPRRKNRIRAHQRGEPGLCFAPKLKKTQRANARKIGEPNWACTVLKPHNLVKDDFNKPEYGHITPNIQGNVAIFRCKLTTRTHFRCRSYRGALLIRTIPRVGPYSSPRPRDL